MKKTDGFKSAPRDPLSACRITFAAACRENTGVSMCDSGGVNGRGWQQPPIPKGAPEIRDWCKGCSACIQTSVFLENRMEILRELQGRWQRWDNRRADLDWFESGAAFMEEAGYHQVDRDNVYNRENDLSSCYVYEVWQKNGEKSDDWIYDRSAVVALYMHTGCDVRGGYGRPIFCRSRGDYVIPIDLCAEYRASPAARPADGCDVDWAHFRAIDERWQSGYASYPYGQLEADVAEWHEETRTRDSVEVTLKTGERVLVTAAPPYFGD